MKIYELKPTDNRKRFYGKAIVEIADDGTETLYSYNTPIVKRTAARLGLVKCSPGWCTGYSDYNGTMAAIKAAIKSMREEAKQTPTWAQYERKGA